MSGVWVRTRTELRAQRRRRAHGCWNHLLAAPLWPKYGVNLGTLLRTCDAVGACLVGTGLSLNVAVAGSLVLYKLAGLI